MTTTPQHRDPIREPPLREPGQSLRDRLEGRFDEVLVPWLAVAVLAITMAIVEWFRWSLGAPYAPVLMTLFAAAVTALAAWRVRRMLVEIKPWRLGLKGERAVGQFLQSTLLPCGYHVIHDVCIDDFNIDHAVIGPGGVFAVEVKTRSKRRGDARVRYDGNRILVDGIAPDRDPLVQARAGAVRLQQILERYTGRQVVVRPVVLFPGWYVERQPSGVQTWVLNDKVFPTFVEREPHQLSAEDARVLAEGLCRYVREQIDR